LKTNTEIKRAEPRISETKVAYGALSGGGVRAGADVGPSSGGSGVSIVASTEAVDANIG
jgi:hypothetical protein